MKALVYGVAPEPFEAPGDANTLTANLARTPTPLRKHKHAIAHYLDLVADGRIDLRPMLTHTFGLEQWRDAFLAIARKAESGAVKVAIDQR